MLRTTILALRLTRLFGCYFLHPRRAFVMNLDAMVTLDTLRALHEHDHQLAAYCGHVRAKALSA